MGDDLPLIAVPLTLKGMCKMSLNLDGLVISPLFAVSLYRAKSTMILLSC